MSVTGGIIAAVGAAGAIGSAAIGSNAAGNAASTQANAADEAAQLQKQEADNSLAFQKQEWQTQQNNEAPFLSAGTWGVDQLKNDLMPGGTLSQGWNTPFVAPTAATEQNDPGYQFRLKQGMEALDRGAAASGNLLTGGTAKAEQQYGQDYASNEYGNVYNRALGQYDQNYNIFENNQNNTYSRLAALAGMGSTTAAQLGQQGQTAATNVGNTYLTLGQQQGQDLQDAAAARASGYVGGANAWGGALSSTASGISNLALLQQLSQFNGATNYANFSVGG